MPRTTLIALFYIGRPNRSFNIPTHAFLPLAAHCSRRAFGGMSISGARTVAIGRLWFFVLVTIDGLIRICATFRLHIPLAPRYRPIHQFECAVVAELVDAQR